jgi:hypothetical protein
MLRLRKTRHFAFQKGTAQKLPENVMNHVIEEALSPENTKY